MKKLFLLMLAFLPMLSSAQVVQAPGGVNFGNGNLFLVQSGNGAPPSACTYMSEYIQLDARAGQNYWRCINGTMIQQTISSTVTGSGSAVLSDWPTLFNASTNNLTVTSLTPGNCVQAGSNGLLMTTSGPCGSGGGGGGGGTVGAGLASQLAFYASNGTTVTGISIIPDSAFPALTGDIQNSAGSTKVVVVGINGQNLSTLGVGLLKNNSSGIPTLAVAGTDFVAPNGSISGTAGNVTGVVAVANGGTGSSTSPQPGQILVSSGLNSYSPVSISGDSSISSTGQVTNNGLNGLPVPANAVALATNAQNQLIAASIAGNGPSLTSGPNSSADGDVVVFTGIKGQIADSNRSILSFARTNSPVFTGTITADQIVDNGLVAGNCVQAGSSGQLVSASQPCGSGSGGFTNPMTSAGDMIVGGTNGSPNRLAASTAATTSVLTESNSAASWTASTGTGQVVLANAPLLTNATLTAPVLGVAVATSINGLTFTQYGRNNILIGTVNNNITGGFNFGLGANSLKALIGGSSNVAQGNFALTYLVNGSSNTAIGTDAGSNTSTSGLNSGSSNSIFIGSETIANGSNDQNEIVIGASAVGLGSNTTVIGTNSTTDTYLEGNTNISNHLNQTAANNTAGTCKMSNSVSCSFNLNVAFNSLPICQVAVQGANPIAGACSVSGTTVTITAATANSEIWGAVLIGSPN